MLGTQNLGLFIGAGLLLNITPGPDTFYILGRTAAQGKRAGIASVLGISSGCMVHTVAAAFGLSVILAQSDSAFFFIKLAGAFYLAYLGLRMLLKRGSQAGPAAASIRADEIWVIYRQGLLTNILNPKVALFFLAFLPQFVAPSVTGHVIPFLFLGSLFILNGTLYCFLLVFFASVVARRLESHRGVAPVLERLAGATFIGIGLRLAFAKRQ